MIYFSFLSCHVDGFLCLLHPGVPLGVGDVPFDDTPEKDGMALLNEILNSTSLEEGGFSSEWMEVFGEGEPTDSPSKSGQPQSEDPSSFFLPSYLLDQNMNSLQSSTTGSKSAGRVL